MLTPPFNMKQVRNFVFSVVTIIALTIGTYAPAANAQSTDTDDAFAALQAQVQVLLDQIQDLTARLDTLRQEQQEAVTEFRETIAELRSQLRVGSRGDEVTSLQEYLAQFPDIYPEALITGYFGPLTEKAVRKFQRKHGIEQVGEVGPKTRSIFNKLLKARTKDGNITKDEAHELRDEFRDNFRKSDDDDDDDGDDDHKKDPNKGKKFGLNKIPICHDGMTLELPIPSITAHLFHGDMLGECDGDGGDDDDGDGGMATTTDMTPPVLSNISATSTATTTFAISWDTDELSTSKVTYATSSPVSNASGAAMSMSASLVTSHSLDLMDLATSTTYYYFVESTDEVGNTATSSDEMFDVPS